MPNRRQGDSEEGIRYDFPIYLSPEDRAHLRIVVGNRGQLIDFALMQEVLFARAWVDVVRYDCHRSFHVHRYTKRGQESKTELGDLDDLDGKFDRAVAEMLEDWEENRRRYLNG